MQVLTIACFLPLFICLFSPFPLPCSPRHPGGVRFLAIAAKIAPAAFLWGLGTALGE